MLRAYETNLLSLFPHLQTRICAQLIRVCQHYRGEAEQHALCWRHHFFIICASLNLHICDTGQAAFGKYSWVHNSSGAAEQYIFPPVKLPNTANTANGARHHPVRLKNAFPFYYKNEVCNVENVLMIFVQRLMLRYSQWFAASFNTPSYGIQKEMSELSKVRPKHFISNMGSIIWTKTRAVSVELPVSATN